jgi:hypothetical protein
MALNRSRLYIILFISCVAGYTWLFINYNLNSTNSKDINVCIIKHVTNIPCPSCGATRSVLSLLNGDFSEAMLWNPLGIFLALILLITPIWISYDYLEKKETLFYYYRKMESAFQQKKLAIPAIILVISNWIWNIYKDL